MAQVESFTLDHNAVKAPYVRLAGTERHESGALLQKYDMRFLQPNQDAIPTGALHTLEHYLAINLRDELEGVVDISPMGCRTGYYMVIWNEHTPAEVAQALANVLKKVQGFTDSPAATAKECGNYKDHSLWGAKEYARLVLEQGISTDPFVRDQVIR